MWPSSDNLQELPFRVARYYDHAYLLEHFASWLRPDLYVELGSANYTTFSRVARHCTRAVAVDLKEGQPLAAELAPRCQHFQMSTRKFLATQLPRLGAVEMAFIDADHQADAAYADFCGLWSVVPPNGFVFLHDTQPPDERHTHPSLCHDSWRVPAMIEAEFSAEAELLTIPFPPGLTVVRRRTQLLRH